ncbi:hypothetical protein PFISCL1PPCAC_4621, partial [Pristionchus fissidentatus]
HRLFYRCGRLPSPSSHPPRMVDTQGHVMIDVIRRKYAGRLDAGGDQTDVDKDMVSQTGAGETQMTKAEGTDATNTPNTPDTKTEGGDNGDEKEKDKTQEEDPETSGKNKKKKKKKKKKKRDRRDKYRGNKVHLMISLIFLILACTCGVLSLANFIAYGVVTGQANAEVTADAQKMSDASNAALKNNADPAAPAAVTVAST